MALMDQVMLENLSREFSVVEPQIRYLVPDLPPADAILPFLREIDANRWYSNFGPLSERFVELLALRYFSVQTAPCNLLATASGTAALELALRSLRLPPGSRVLLPHLTFPATATAVINCGYRPVLAPVDAASWQLTPQMAALIAEKTPLQCVLPVAAFGVPVPVGGWEDFRQRTGLPVLIDAAAALGNQDLPDDIPVVFSLHATKTLGIGEGGLLYHPDVEVAARLKRQSNFGFAEGRIADVGTNAKLSEYHAAVGLAQLRRMDKVESHRSALYRQYLDLLRPLTMAGAVRLQRTPDSRVPHAMVMHLNAMPAEQVRACLAGKGIETRRLYWPSLARHTGIMRYGELAPVLARQPELLDVADRLLALPFHSRLRHADVAEVCCALRQFMGDGIDSFVSVVPAQGTLLSGKDSPLDAEKEI